MTLTELSPGRLWCARQPLRFGPLAIHTRMTVVRLDDGGLWVHSPIQPTEALVAQLQALGPVRHVVAPNRSHHLFFSPFLAAFPEAGGFIAPGLEGKRPDLSAHRRLVPGEAMPWTPELPSWFIEGLPVINETVFFHPATGTLVLTDLLFRFGDDNRGLARLAARLLGVYDRLAMSRTMKLMVRDRAALRRSIEPLLALDVRRIVLAHDQVVEHEARAALARAFAWLQA